MAWMECRHPGTLTKPRILKRECIGACRVQWKLREITREKDGNFTLFYDTPDGAREVRADGVYKPSTAISVAPRIANERGTTIPASDPSHWILMLCGQAVRV